MDLLSLTPAARACQAPSRHKNIAIHSVNIAVNNRHEYKTVKLV